MVGANVEVHKGGLVLAWNIGLQIQVLSVTRHSIHLKVESSSFPTILPTGVYGPSHFSDRYILWQFLEEAFLDNSLGPKLLWLLMGDFN